MKTNHIILSLVSLSFTMITASATTAPTENISPVTLPVFEVKVQRQNSVEQEVARNLNELRAIAAKPLVVKFSNPLPEAKSISIRQEPKTPEKIVILAGL